MIRPLIAGISVLLAGGATPDQPVTGQTPRIEITAGADQASWTVRYRLDRPTTRLLFPRSTDDSRVRRWRASPGIEIVSTPEGEAARRRDSRLFTEASFAVEPRYVELPKDYAPFSPFGDGGRLFHTGRFFACAERCPEAPRWSMTLRAPRGQTILLDGRRLRGETTWVDADSGRNVYVGRAKPAETTDFVAVIDEALPAPIRGQLSEDLPRYMRLFAGKLGALTERPMLFVSYDLSHRPGWGRQGGTLPGQVFVHFYGDAWPARLARPDFPDELSWHLAHEAAHLHQRQIFTVDSRDAWIHEGGAEALAYLAVRETDPAAAEAALVAARTKCGTDLKGRSVRDAIKAGTFEAAYSCGLLINLSIDGSVRRAAPSSDGLYEVWRRYIVKAGARSPADAAPFLAVLAELGGPGLATAVDAEVARAEPSFRLSP